MVVDLGQCAAVVAVDVVAAAGDVEQEEAAAADAADKKVGKYRAWFLVQVK